MTAAEINRRVAMAMGAKAFTVPCVLGHELHGRYYVTYTSKSIIHRVVEPWRIKAGQYEPYTEEMLKAHGLERDIPNFCTDPAAADLVRQEIERRGWEWDTEARWVRGVIGWDACVCIQPSDSGDSIRWKHSVNSPHEALCLAFLAACDAAKEANGG